jgi:spermidine synthase
MIGGAVYAFSLILAAFLLALGSGSALGAWLSKRIPRPVYALAACQTLIVGAIAASAFLLALWLPYWSVPAKLASPWPLFFQEFLRALAAVAAPAFFWGASFPFALASCVQPGRDPARSAGLVYALNTAGAILGAIGFSALAIPLIGTHASQRLLIALSAAAALAALAPLFRQSRLGASAACAALAALAAVCVVKIPETPWGVVAYGRKFPDYGLKAWPLYLGEGATASIAVTAHETARMFHTSGRIEASSSPQDMRLQLLLGHLPAMLHPRPRSVLIVGCGAGVTAGSFALYPEVERIVIVDIESLVPRAARTYFAEANNQVLSDPRTTVVHDDARHFILTTREKFDIITSDPIHPWVKGSATLYSAEYFELCRRRLHPGGIVTQWVPLYESSVETVKCEFATFFHAFPQATAWANDTLFGEGYDLVLLGQLDPSPIDVDQLDVRFGQPDYERIAAVLKEVGLGSATGLLSTYAGRHSGLKPWLRGAAVNHDRNLRLQYLAGLGLNLRQADPIYGEILRHRSYPEDLLIASPARHRELRKAMFLPAPSQ